MEENRITVVQALDERDLLVKKIMNKMQKAQFVDLIRPKASVTREKRLTRAAFAAEAQSALQQIQDLIARYDSLNAAITCSNANTFLETSRGRMTVSCAIALRNRLRGSGSYGELTDFEGRLAKQMETGYQEMQALQRRKNETVRREGAEKKKGAAATQIVLMKNGRAAGKSQGGPGAERGKGTDTDAPRSDKGEELLRLFDPLNLRRRAEEITEEREAILAELETKIKISNATTFVTVAPGPAAARAEKKPIPTKETEAFADTAKHARKEVTPGEEAAHAPEQESGETAKDCVSGELCP